MGEGKIMVKGRSKGNWAGGEVRRRYTKKSGIACGIARAFAAGVVLDFCQRLKNSYRLDDITGKP